MGRWRVASLAFCLSASLAGCTVVNVGTGETKDITAVGVVRVRVPVPVDGLVAIERSGVGLGWETLPGGGAYLGWSGASWVIADPSKCQLLIIVRSKAQAENAQDIMSKLKGETPCIVDQSHLPH